jgi:hypothetical protein
MTLGNIPSCGDAPRKSTANTGSAVQVHLAWDEFSLEGLAARLSSAQWRADEEFAAYGLAEAEILDLRRWVQAWADDIDRRIYREAVDDEQL